MLNPESGVSIASAYFILSVRARVTLTLFLEYIIGA